MNYEKEILESKSLKRLDKIDSILIFCSFLVIILFFNQLTFQRYLLSLDMLKNNAWSYIIRVFSLPFEDTGGLNVDTVINLYGGIDGLEIFPVSWETFKSEFVIFFQLLFSRNYIDYFEYLLPFIADICRVILCVLPLFVLAYFLLRKYFDFHENEKVENTKELNNYLKFKRKFILPFIHFCSYYIKRFLASKYFQILLWLFLAYINFYSVIMDVIGWYLYFVSHLSFESIWNLLSLNLIDLAPFLVKIHWTIYLTIFYILFDKIRQNRAYKKLNHFVNYILGFIKTLLGVFTRIHGAPGTGKTLLMTDLTDASEQLLRSEASDIIHEVQTQFPSFPFLNLEKVIDKEREAGTLKNHYQVKHFINYVISLYNEVPIPENFFGYIPEDIDADYEFNNSLYSETVFEAVRDYAQAYFIFSTKSPLSVTNYALRHDCRMIDKGYEKVWKYESIKVDPISVRYSMYSKIINFDYFRIKKVDVNNKQKYMYDAAVTSWTEYDKERRNQFYTNKLVKDAVEANQLNDGSNDLLKLKRHDATIRYRLFFRGYYDCQREGSINSDVNETCETVLYIARSDKGWESSLFMWWLEPMICEAYLGWYRRINKLYRTNRAKNTLFIYIIRSIARIIFTYYTKRHNQFDYRIMKLNIDDGSEERRPFDYPLIKARAFRKKYASDCYSGFFEEDYLQANCGFDDLASFKDIYPTLDEFEQMNSFMIRDFKGNLLAVDKEEFPEDFTY